MLKNLLKKWIKQITHISVHSQKNAKHEDGIDIDIYDISKNSARAKVITEDEAGVKELMQYDNCVFLFMSSKDIYKFEEMLIEAKKSI